jgi:hypothetical protein
MSTLKVLRELPGKGYLVQLSGNRRQVLPPTLLTPEERASAPRPPVVKRKPTNIGDPMPHGHNPSADSFKSKRR